MLSEEEDSIQTLLTILRITHLILYIVFSMITGAHPMMVPKMVLYHLKPEEEPSELLSFLSICKRVWNTILLKFKIAISQIILPIMEVQCLIK